MLRLCWQIIQVYRNRLTRKCAISYLCAQMQLYKSVLPRQDFHKSWCASQCNETSKTGTGIIYTCFEFTKLSPASLSWWVYIGKYEWGFKMLGNHSSCLGSWDTAIYNKCTGGGWGFRRWECSCRSWRDVSVRRTPRSRRCCGTPALLASGTSRTLHSGTDAGTHLCWVSPTQSK